MKRYMFSPILIVTLSSLIFLSGCGSTPTSSSASSKQTQAASSSVQGQTSAASGQSSSSGQGTAQGSGQSLASGTGSAVSPAMQSPETLSASWTDAKSDVISPLDVTKPDSIPDGHFHLALQFPQPVELQSIFIRYSEFGKELRWDWIYDNHLTPAGYSLGVFEKGTLLPSGPDTGLKRSGQVDLDLFAAGLNNAKGRDTFSFEPGENFQIELNYISQTGERKMWSTKLTSQ